MTSRLYPLKVSIVAAVAVKPSTIYSINVENAQSGQSWCVRRCFSQFYDLRARLVELLGDIEDMDVTYPLVFFRFPSRSLFGSRRSSVIQHRVVALEKFLQAALQVANSRDVETYPHTRRCLTSAMETFLSCANPITSHHRSNNKSMRLLKGTVWGQQRRRSSVTSSTRSSMTSDMSSNPSTVDEEHWTIAGDAVGLWAAAKTHPDPDHPFIQGTQPRVYTEMLLG